MDPAELVDSSAALIATLDRDGRILQFNARCEEVSGLDREAACGRSWLELFALDDREGVSGRVEAARQGRAVTPFVLVLPGQEGKPRWIRWHLTALCGDRVCATGIDVTDDQEAAARSRRVERIAALGTMTAGLAHEIRNPLNAAHLQLDLARRRLSRDRDQAAALQALEIANAEVSRLARLVDEFLLFARPDPLQLARGDLRVVAASTLEALRAEASERQVELRLEPGEPVCAAFDDIRMNQALQHLVRNAIEAHDVGGMVRVALSASGGEAHIAVEDGGRGFPAGTPIFEPFYTTKAQGTGLGLAIAHRIVSDHGGSIAVESRPGRTLFQVSLPAC